MRKCDKPVEPHGVLSVTLWFDSDNSWEYTGPCSHDLITHTSSVLLNAQPLALFSLTVMAELGDKVSPHSKCTGERAEIYCFNLPGLLLIFYCYCHLINVVFIMISHFSMHNVALDFGLSEI